MTENERLRQAREAYREAERPIWEAYQETLRQTEEAKDEAER